ncbi:MAG: PAS domain S-box protein [Planctomycetes bacterium]|nr:PAS domain S-box protein [Planctomycetota bacterium]
MAGTLRVLIVEDSEDDALLMVRKLQHEGYTVVFVRVETAQAMTDALEREKWDVILSDYTLPHFSGTAALSLLKEKGLDIPFIIVTGTVSDVKAVSAMKAGAHDYIMKNNLARLPAAIERELREAVVRQEKKLADDALRESEEKLRIITASAGDAVMMIDDDGLITFWNKAAEKMFGYTYNEATGKEIHKLIVPEKHHQDFVTGFKTFKETGQGRVIGKTLELEGRRKDGTMFSAEHTISAVNIKGKWHAIGVARDITERKKAEEMQRKQGEELQTIIESSPAMIFYKDAENRFIHINHALAEAVGLPKEALEGKSCFDVFPLHAERYWKDDKEVIASGQPKTGIIEQMAAKKGTRWVQTDKVPYRDEKGNIIGIIGFAVDITSRKQAEEGLLRSYEKLRKTLEQTAFALSSTVEKRDPYIAGHQRRVTAIACAIAVEMGFSENQIEGIRIAGLLHDIGKIAISSDILSKPGKISAIELELIKTHVQVSYEILKDIEFPWPIAQMVFQHHERVNGSGYPQGLSHDKILPEARILCVADVVEAMVSHRPYRAALGIDAALEEISQKRGVLYDAGVVDTCTKLFREKGFKFE